MISLSDLLSFYKRKDIQEAILKSCKNREVAVRFSKDGSFGKRPDVLSYESDIIEMVKQGASSFHVSEEIWSNPLNLNPNMSRRELDNLRIGWDLVLDVDCKILDYSAIAADLIIRAIKHHGIKNVSCKFSGNHGFHIGVCFESFPKEVVGYGLTKNFFPEGPRKIAEYIKFMIKEHLGNEMLRKDGIEIIAKKTGKKFNDLVKDNAFDAFSVLSIDTILIASRHLSRTPYSFNEKSGLISVPINPDKVLEFNKAVAMPKNVKISKHVFLEHSKSVANEAKKLIIAAFDFEERKVEKVVERRIKFEDVGTAIPEELFPQSIKKVLNGLEDGRKRAVFILINFLTSVGWDYDKVEARLKEWNKKNKEPLREVYMLGQLRYHKTQKKKILPPNYDKGYYKDIGCAPSDDELKYKNPVNYAKRRAFLLNYRK